MNILSVSDKSPNQKNILNFQDPPAGEIIISSALTICQQKLTGKQSLPILENTPLIIIYSNIHKNSIESFDPVLKRGLHSTLSTHLRKILFIGNTPFLILYFRKNFIFYTIILYFRFHNLMLSNKIFLFLAVDCCLHKNKSLLHMSAY